MYDIYSDELDEMYKIEKHDNLNLGKGITPTDSIKTLLGGKFIVLNENVTLREAIDHIQKQHIGCILLENDDKISGIFTERDVVQKIVGKRHDLDKEYVIDYMTLKPDVLHQNDAIGFALNKMIEGGYRHIPIINKSEKPVGIISMQDIINHLGDYFYEDIKNLPPTPLRKQNHREGG